MTRPKQWIEMDAIDGYRVQDIEDLLARVDGRESVVIIKNAHLLTAKAFYRLYGFFESKTQELKLVLVSNEPEKIFPPILDYVEIAA